VEHAQPLPQQFPWRAAAVLAGGFALVELVALIAIGLVQIAPHPTTRVASSRVAHTAAPPARHVQRAAVVRVPSVPLRPRSRVRILVLNGNGVSGAAAAQAARLHADGYAIAGATNAQRHDYAQSMVMFVPGWAKEARRLAHETGVRLVSPVDGLRRAQLRGSTVVLLLGR
jgi:hypothetical protein